MTTMTLSVQPCDASDTPVAHLTPQWADFVLQGANPGLLLTNLSSLEWVVQSTCQMTHLRCIGVDGEAFSLPTGTCYLFAGDLITCPPGSLRLTMEQSFAPPAHRTSRPR